FDFDQVRRKNQPYGLVNRLVFKTKPLFLTSSVQTDEVTTSDSCLQSKTSHYLGVISKRPLPCACRALCVCVCVYVDGLSKIETLSCVDIPTQPISHRRHHGNNHQQQTVTTNNKLVTTNRENQQSPPHTSLPHHRNHHRPISTFHL
ncbi:unnamed protein product, partial [Lymnaea stagnalis]